MTTTVICGILPTTLFTARAQSVTKIERYALGLDAVLSPSEQFRELWVGNGGQGRPAEGPVWISEGGYLLFNDMASSRRLKYAPGQGVTVAMQPNGGANGLTRDLQGRLISCEGETRRVTRTNEDGTITVVAESFEGKRIPPPNDVVVKSDGSIYFTCPRGTLQLGENDAEVGVYRVSPDLTSVTLVANDLSVPNGISFSPDERILYISDSSPRHIRAYAVSAKGEVVANSGRLFADLSGTEQGTTDGIKVNTAGNVFSGGAGGLYILDSQGMKLGRIVHGLFWTTNVAFGGDDWKTLYFTTRSSLNMINMKIPGIRVPTKAKPA
jgi:gluconolactonase